MKALTVLQPFAWAIANGHKLVENRTWTPVPGASFDFGERIAIHAGKAWHDRFGGVGAEGIRSRLAELERKNGGPLPPGVVCPVAPPLGAIVATAKLMGFVSKAEDLEIEQRAWFEGPWGWVLADVRRVSPAIPAKGALGLWQLGDELAAQVLGRQEPATSFREVGSV